MEQLNLPGSVLADLYVRIRNEIVGDERNLDPNDKLRAPIAMAILSAVEIVGADIVAIEAHARLLLGQMPRRKPIAA